MNKQQQKQNDKITLLKFCKEKKRSYYETYSKTMPLTNYTTYVNLAAFEDSVSNAQNIPNSAKFIDGVPTCNIIIPNSVKIYKYGFKHNKKYISHKIISCDCIYKNIINVINITNLNMYCKKQNLYRLFHTQNIYSIRLCIRYTSQIECSICKIIICLINTNKVDLNLSNCTSEKNTLLCLRNIYLLKLKNHKCILNILNNVHSLFLINCFQNLMCIKNIYYLNLTNCKCIRNITKIKIFTLSF